MGRHRNREQSKILINFMQLHKDLATCRIAPGERESIELWKSLTEELNASGPPVKDCSEWKKVWTDWKKATRKKLAQPEDRSHCISEYEKVIIELCGWTTTVFKEYETDENSTGSSTSSDTPLKIGTAVQNETLHMDPLIQESEELLETATSKVPSSSIEELDEQYRGQHRNAKQSKILLTFMKLHKNIARGRSQKCDQEKDKMSWEELAVELNACGPPRKSTIAWKSSWKDWKSATRKKLTSKKFADNRSGLTKEEQCIVELCELKEPCEKKYISDENSEGSLISFSNTAFETSFVKNTNCNNMAKKRKFKEESSSEIYDENQHLMQDTPRAPTLTSIERSLADVRTGVTNIQTSLQELCRLMSEQNQEIRRLMTEQNQEFRRFATDSKRHYFVMEKEMIERKRDRLSKS